MNEVNQRLKSFVERIERLNEEKSALQEDIKEVFSEAKSAGFDVKAMKEVIKLRKMEKHKRDELLEVVELYKQAVGV